MSVPCPQSRGATTGTKRAQSPHSIIRRAQACGRPCCEAGNSACRGEQRRGVGGPSGAQCRCPGKRAWRTPTPTFAPVDRKVSRGSVFFGEWLVRSGWWLVERPPSADVGWRKGGPRPAESIGRRRRNGGGGMRIARWRLAIARRGRIITFEKSRTIWGYGGPSLFSFTWPLKSN